MDRNAIVSSSLVDIEASPPARVAWIEIRHYASGGAAQFVATREGGVDRNAQRHDGCCVSGVATREGGVDRNAFLLCTIPLQISVATREGGVDRNTLLTNLAMK